MERYSLTIGQKTIDYTLQRRERKHIRINVLPDLSVQVIAPLETQIDDIFYRVRKRATWILKQQRYFEQFHPFEPDKDYTPGETHKYLGRQYRLKVVEAENNDVKLKGRYIFVFSNQKKDTQQTEKLLYEWYRKHAKKKYELIIDKFIPKLSKYGISKPKLTIRRMKSRWGSCKADNKHIMLNLELVKTPVHCIEYVIMHELCHLKHQKHTKEYYQFLTMMMPDWEKRKLRLEKAGL